MTKSNIKAPKEVWVIDTVRDAGFTLVPTVSVTFTEPDCGDGYTKLIGKYVLVEENK